VTSIVVIDERFRGPPDSANGGYTCALLARWIDGPAEVTLRAPPPLDTPLTIQRGEQKASLVRGDGALIAEAVPATIAIDVPNAVSMDAARLAASANPWRDRHPYPTCFVCGPRRQPGDGMRIFPGPVQGEPVFAAPWTPEASLADAQGMVRDEFVWAALDCPSGVVTDRFGDVGRILLGRLAAHLRLPVAAGRPHLVEAWTVAREGRKLNTASALYTAHGALCAAARAVWIEVSEKD
jgi:hypothetical protein